MTVKRYFILAVCIVALGASGRRPLPPNQEHTVYTSQRGNRVVYNPAFDYEDFEQKTAKKLSKGKGNGSTWPLALIMIAGVGILGVAGNI